jgi:hypothetical protein
LRYQFFTQLPDGTNAGMDPEQELFRVQNQIKLYACFLNAAPYYSRGVFIRYDKLKDSVEGKDAFTSFSFVQDSPFKDKFAEHGFHVNYVTSYDYALAKS